jgi:hypothetical protein
MDSQCSFNSVESLRSQHYEEKGTSRNSRLLDKATWSSHSGEPAAAEGAPVTARSNSGRQAPCNVEEVWPARIMSAKAGLQSQLFFALGVIVVLFAIISDIVGEFRPLYALGIGLVGLGFAFGAWRQMHR